MSINKPEPQITSDEKIDNSPEAIEAARQLIKGDPILENDERIRYVLEHNGISREGKVVDIGDLIANVKEKASKPPVFASEKERQEKIKESMAQDSKPWQNPDH